MKWFYSKKNEVLSVGAVVLLLVLFVLAGQFIDLDFVNSYVERAGIWAPIVFILVKSSTIVFAPLSGSPLYILVGTLFGTTEGIIYAFLGDLLGFSVLFYLARAYGWKLINFITKGEEVRVINKIIHYTENYKSFLKVCIIFFWFPEAAMVAAGMSKLKYSKVFLIFMPIYSIGVSLLIVFSSYLLSI